MKKATELLATLTKLASKKNKKNILDSFCLAVNNLFPPLEIAYSKKKPASVFTVFELTQARYSFGHLIIKNYEEINDTEKQLIETAITQLIILLKNQADTKNLKNQINTLRKSNDKKEKDLTLAEQNNSKARIAAINLIEDLSHEIEKRVQTEKELRESEEKYKRIAENINDVVWTADINLNTTYVSPSVYNLTGETPEEHAAKSILERYPQKDVVHINKILKEELTKEKNIDVEKNRSQVIELEAYTKAGDTIWVAMNVSFMRDKQGNPIGFQGVTRNIDEKKRTELALQQSENQYKQLFNNMAQGFVLHDTVYNKKGKPVDFIYRDVNPAFEKLTGFKADEVKGRTIRQIMPLTEEYWFNIYGEVVEKQKSMKYENYAASLGKYYDVSAFSPQPGKLAIFFTDISETKKAQIALKKSEEKYRNLFEANKDGIVVFSLQKDKHFKIIETNKASLEILGYKQKDHPTANPMDLEVGVSKETLMQRIEKLQKEGSLEFETRFYHQKGHVIDLSVTAISINYLGQPAIYNILRDITERKKMERLMQARIELLEYAENHSLEDLLRKTMETAETLTESTIGFFHFIDQEKGVVESHLWSEATLRSQCTVGEQMNKHYPLAEAGVWVECVNEGKPVIHNDYKALPHKKGMPRGHVPLQRELIVPVGRHNKVVSVLGVGNKKSDYNENDVTIIQQLAELAWDISERKTAEQKLHESEGKYKLIFEKSPLGVLHFDKTGTIDELNGHFVRIIGSSREKLLGLNMKKLPDTRIVEAVNTVLKGEPAFFEGVYTSVTANKTTPIRLLFSPVLNDNNEVEGGIGLVEDRSLHIQREELKKQMGIAKESVKFKQNFLANMSHEIRTPLTGVLGMIDILEQTSLTEKQQGYINILKNSGENLKEIINQVLDFSKIEAGKVELKPSVFEFKTIPENAVRLFDANRKENVELNIDIDKNIPCYIIADANRISQVVNNLISNAVKFTNEGSIQFKAALDSELPDSGQLVIKIMVTDTGIGIPSDMQEKLFMPFSQIDDKDTRSYEGTGLGLTICRELVNMHGGEIGVSSQYKKGSTFWFTFVAKIPDSAVISHIKSAVSSKPAQSLSQRKLNILFAEDKAVNQKVVKLMLTSLGHNVTIANNGQQALEFYKPGKYDLILMDIQMPVMDGIAATQKIKETYKTHPPIVGLSANAFEGDREKYMNLGMDEYITKPIKKTDFIELVNKVTKKENMGSKVDSFMDNET